MEQLIELQNIDTKLKDLNDLLGDLPSKVEDLNNQEESTKDLITGKKTRSKELDLEINRMELDISDSSGKIGKLKDQLFLVSYPKTGRTWLRHMIDSMIDESNQNLNIFYTHDHSEILTEDGIKNNTELIFKNIKIKIFT